MSVPQHAAGKVVSARSNARWVATAQATRLGVQVLGMLILSRLLSPADFGLVAMASIVSNFAIMLRDLGTGAALIQKPELHDDTVLATFWLNTGIGIALALIITAAAPLIAAAFDAPALKPLLMLLSLSFPLTSMAVVHQSLLERASRFSVVARIEIVSFLTALVVAVGSAWAGAGAYSLILQTIAAALLGSAQLWMVSTWRPRMAWPLRELKQLTGFSTNLFAFGMVNYFSRNADAMVIGRFFNAASLGAYSLSYRLMLFPLQNLTAVANRALFPVFSGQHARPQETAALYLRTLSLIALFTAPLMAGLFALRAPFVAAVLGAKWSLAVPIIAWLAPCGFLQSLVSTSGCVFMAKGRTDILFRIGVGCAIVQVAAFFIGVRWGVPGVAACYFIANLLCAGPVMHFVAKQLQISLIDIVMAVRAPVLLALLMGAVLSAGVHFTASTLPSPLLQLITLAAAGALLYALTVHVMARQHEQDAWRLLLSRA